MSEGVCEPEEGSDTWKAMIYELHVELKCDKKFACRYGCGDQYGIDRINTHMFKRHNWKYPKLGVGKKVPSEIHEWEDIWRTWDKNLKNEDKFQSKPNLQPLRRQINKKIPDLKIDWRMERSVVEKKVAEFAKVAIPNPVISSPPPVHPMPLACEIFTPQFVGEESFTDAYLAELHTLLVAATQEQFESALTTLCASKNSEDAQNVRIKASSEFFYLLLPHENRGFAISQAEHAYNDVKEYVHNLEALKAWQSEKIRNEEKVKSKRDALFVAKMIEYDCMQPGSAVKDWHSRKCKLTEDLDYHTRERQRIIKELKDLEDFACGQEGFVPAEMTEGKLQQAETTEGNLEEQKAKTTEGKLEEEKPEMTKQKPEMTKHKAQAELTEEKIQAEAVSYEHTQGENEFVSDMQDVDPVEPLVKKKKKKKRCLEVDAEQSKTTAAADDFMEAVAKQNNAMQAVAKQNNAKRKHVSFKDSPSTTGKRFILRTRLRDKKEQGV